MRPSRFGLPITISADNRITPFGKLLRAAKLDELPQLINILKGDMTFVGPRPEIPQFVDPASRLWRTVLSVPPGLLDAASLEFARESELLAQCSEPVAAYRDTILPQKLAASQKYLAERTAAGDLKLLLRAMLHALTGWKTLR